MSLGAPGNAEKLYPLNRGRRLCLKASNPQSVAVFIQECEICGLGILRQLRYQLVETRVFPDRVELWVCFPGCFVGQTKRRLG